MKITNNKVKVYIVLEVKVKILILFELPHRQTFQFLLITKG